jgi:hypothetical protein
MLGLFAHVTFSGSVRHLRVFTTTGFMWSLWNSFEFRAYELLYKPFWILGFKVLLDLEPFKVLQLYRSWNPYVCCRASRDGFKTFLGDDFCGVLACLEKSALPFPMNVPFYFVCSIISFIIIASMNILLCYENVNDCL